MTDLAGKRVTVMGLGRFGGGIGVTRWLCSQGADVLVTDTDPAEELADSLTQIRPLIDSGQVTLRLGEHNVSDFTTCDLIIANVAVPKPWDNRFLRSAEAAGVPITTEITLTVQRLRDRGVTRTIGITGTAGKSTTTAMIHYALTHSLGEPGVIMGGNIGGSLLPEVDRITPADILVLELSSAMLYWLDHTLTPKWSPHIAVITNISANHIDWHADLAHYSSSKKHLIEHQHPADSAILGESVWPWRESTQARCLPIDPAAFATPLRLPGDHNRLNAAAALAACRAIAPDAETRALEAAIAAFTGLTHRLQLVSEVKLAPSSNPVRFYNDSKSTTPDSALKAVQAIAAMPGGSLSRIHLIAGGHDKGSDLSPISRLAGELAGLYTIGVTGPTIARAAASANVAECQTLDRAVPAAIARMKPGDALLLSPACASWDQYTNFEARGEEFIRLVRQATAP